MACAAPLRQARNVQMNVPVRQLVMAVALVLPRIMVMAAPMPLSAQVAFALAKMACAATNHAPGSARLVLT